MRILFCTNAYPPHFIGGAELIAHQQASALSSLGHEMYGFVGDTSGKIARHDIVDDELDGIPIKRIGLDPIDFNADFPNFHHPEVESRFIETVQDFQPDLVHCHNLIGLSAYLPFLAKIYGARVALTLHDHWGYCLKSTAEWLPGTLCTDSSRCATCQTFVNEGRGKYIPILLRKNTINLLTEFVDIHISPSNFLADCYRIHHPKTLLTKVVWNGINLQRFTHSLRTESVERFQFLFAGYLGKHKGILTLIDAFSSVALDTNATLAIAGDGDLLTTCKESVKRHGLEKRVIFYGKIPNEEMPRLLSESDALVLPSIWPENQPVSITEAMAAGLPVIASNLGGIPELLSNPQAGLLVEANNTAALENSMRQLCGDRALCRKLGEAGRSRIREHDFSKQAKELAFIFSSIPKPLSIARSRQLVACVSDRFDDSFNAEAIAAKWAGFAPHFVYSAWVRDDLLIDGDIALVVGSHGSLTEAYRLMKRGVALVVPEYRRDLREIVQRLSCGLVYSDYNEAARQVAYLLEHDDLRRSLGENSKISF